MEAPFTSATFDISIKEAKPTITRSWIFKNGDTISFAVVLEQDSSATVSDLHIRSIKAAINHLQTLIPPQ